MRVIATADVGGTHARFALAAIDDCKVVDLGEPVTVKTGEFASFQHAWQEFGRRIEQPLPKELAIAFAGPVGGDVLKLTNNPWVIRPALMFERLGVERLDHPDINALPHGIANALGQHPIDGEQQDFGHVSASPRRRGRHVVQRHLLQ